MKTRAAGKHSRFDVFSRWASRASGHPFAFAGALGVVALWLITGPIFRFSDTWQLVINTGTTVVTFLMVFVIQHSQNRDTAAMQLKLDELLRAVGNAKNELMDLEELEEHEVERMRIEYCLMAQQAREKLRSADVAAGADGAEAETSV
ncbi:hypothetical protein BH11PLA1_BH11PLA1_01710 [soil metagenome]